MAASIQRRVSVPLSPSPVCLAWRTRIMRVSLGSVSYAAAGTTVCGAELLRIGREAAQGREEGAAAQKSKNSFLPHYQHTKQKNFAVLCSTLH